MHNSWEFLFKKSSKDFVALVPEKTFAMAHKEKRYTKSFRKVKRFSLHRVC